MRLAHKKIRQSNDLIESPYSQDFSPYEIKLFEISGASLLINDISDAKKRINKRNSLTSSQLASLLNTSVSSISHEIEKTAIKIMNKKIHLRKVLDDGSVEFEMINIIPYAKYKDGIFEYDLNHAIIPYILEINKNFTEFQLHFLLMLRSAYAIKLYKLLYQYKTIKSRIFSVMELKKQFGISEKYSRYNDFKKDVLESSVSQINELTDLNVIYEEIKLGRKVEKLEFRFELKKTSKPEKLQLSPKTAIIDVEPISQDLQSSLEVSISPSLTALLMPIEAEITKSTKNILEELYSTRGHDFIEVSIDYAKRNATKNFEKYLLDTVNKNWAFKDLQKKQSKKTADKISVDKIKQKELAEQHQKEQDAINKSEIEHLFSKLSDQEQDRYAEFSLSIFNRHKVKLEQWNCTPDIFKLSVFAVSNNRSYNKILELYFSSMVRISLSLNDYLV